MIIVDIILLANVAYDRVVRAHQPIFTSLFGTEYRYSGAGVGYQMGSIIGGGFTPIYCSSTGDLGRRFMALYALYLAVGCLLTALVAALVPKTQDE